MDEAIIAGIFTILGVIIGIFSSIVLEFLKERKERKNNVAHLCVNLETIKAYFEFIKGKVGNYPSITTSDDLKPVIEILESSKINNEISKLEMLFEKSIQLNFDNTQLLIDLKWIIKDIEFFRYSIEVRSQPLSFPDAKPEIIDKLNAIIDSITTFCEQLE
jgi:hypothetical protein